ncbi:MAG: rhomboid family intramembrane serine protease [Ignavibacteriae bacterium]|nr:rhomboid family intramembrane serine protease [Ignavibacteriota bacterium]
MIPLRDANPTRTFPFVNYTVIGVNVLAFFYELSLGKYLEEFIFSFGVVPARFLYDLNGFDLGLSTFMPFVTSMFLHGGWMHLIGNMLFLHVFGDNVEDRVGHTRYVFFYVLAGFAAALTQTFINPNSEVPMIGASGAIAGVLGAYVLIFPRAKVAALVPFFGFFQIVEVQASFFLGFWFLMQVFSGLFALGIASDAGGVAWWAHIGGFAAGAAMIPLLKKRQWS